MISKFSDGRTDLVFDLIAQGYDAKFTDPHGTSLISWCAYYGDVSAIKYLISKGASLKDLGENFDLNGAVFHGHWQLTQFLLEQGADVNHALPDTGETALHSALCKVNNPVYARIIELLLAHGANPNIATKPRQETGSFMRDTFTKQETPLHRAAAFASAGTIKRLLDAGADKTIKDMNGDTPLSWASWHLRPDHILAMLCYGKYAIHPERVKRALDEYLPG
ncbi:MAG: ankyrin repeat domain-containing protein [Bacteroidota bacterium]